MFEWWNHWPVAQVGSSGRPAIAPDRPSHASLSHIYWNAYATSSESETKLLLSGLMQRAEPDSALNFARSWLQPPSAELADNKTRQIAYDPAQRAYVVPRLVAEGAKKLTIRLSSSANRPLFDPAFVVESWSAATKVRVLADGKQLNVVPRIGTERGPDGETAVIFLNMTAFGNVELEIERAGS